MGDDNSLDEEVQTLVDDFDEQDDQDQIADVENLTFGLEHDLQHALRTNIERLERGLSIIDNGRELASFR